MGFLATLKRRVVEALGGSLLGDYSDIDPGLEGFRRLSDPDGTFRRDLSPLSQERMTQIGHYLYASNPMARRVIDIRVNLTVGREVGYICEVDRKKAEADGRTVSEDQAQEIVTNVRRAVDRFWEHPTHDVRHRAQEYATQYLVSGELILPLADVNEVDGVPQLDVVDAKQVTDVVAVKGSSMVADAVVVQGTNAGQPVTRKIIRLTPAGVYEGECHYFRHGRLLNSLRGVSDLMDISDWLDGHDQFLFASLDRVIVGNNLVWDLKVDGANAELVKAEVKLVTGSLTKPGGVYGHNEKTSLDPKRADFQGSEMDAVARLFRTHILGSKGIPEAWYSEGGNANRATAGEQTDVAYKDLLALQEEFRRIFRTILHAAYDSIQAKQAGAGAERLPTRAEGWLVLEPDLPPIQERDLSRQSNAFVQTVNAVGSAIEDELLSTKTARKLVLGIVDKMGVSVDPAEEQALIDEEAEEREAAGAEMQARMARDRIGPELEKKPPADKQPSGEPPAPPEPPESDDPERRQPMTRSAASRPPSQPQQEPSSLAVNLNGAQIQAATAIVAAVAAGEIPRDSGIAQLEVLFGLERKLAERLIGTAGTTKPTTPNPQAGPGAQREE
jgi:hypothetical protein